MIKSDLHILRQTAAHALEIHFFCVGTTGLYKKLMPGFIRKSDNLILYTGAIAGAYPFNFPSVQRGTMYILQYNMFSFLVRPRYIAGLRILLRRQCIIRKGNYGVISILPFQVCKINAGTQHPGGSSCFKAPQTQAQFPKGLTQKTCRKKPIRPAFIGNISHINTTS